MFKYILKRIGYMLVTLLIISAVTFFMMHSIPGDPLGATVNKLRSRQGELLREVRFGQAGHRAVCNLLEEPGYPG